MTREEFNKRIEESLEKIKNTLTIKGAEYDRNDNPFHAFETAALLELEGKYAFEIPWDYARKHFVSIMDMKKDMKTEGIVFHKDVIEEKYNDLIIYFLLEKELVLEFNS